MVGQQQSFDSPTNGHFFADKEVYSMLSFFTGSQPRTSTLE